MTETPNPPPPDPRRHGDDIPQRTPQSVFRVLAIAAGVGLLLGAMIAVPCVMMM